MGFFDKLKDKAGEKYTEISKNSEIRGCEKRLREREKEDKVYIAESILERFEIRWLKNMCKYYKVGEPEPTEFNFKTQNRVKVRVTKRHWIEYAASKLTMDEIKKYAKDHKVKYADLEREQVKLKDKREQEYFTKLQQIKAKYEGEEFSAEALPAKDEYSFLQQVKSAIDSFEPSRRFNQESLYQMELNGWLKSQFPESYVDIEVRKGYSRPDIVVDDVAIEVKGPTTVQDLETIFGKCHRYLQEYDDLIVMLFHVDVKEQRFQDWKAGIEEHFPEVVIIRKD